MKTYKKLITAGIISLVLMINEKAAAQENNEPTRYSTGYTNGIGFRFGTDLGLTFKHFYRSDVAWEGIVSSGYKAFDFTFLWEKHMNAFKTPGMNFFFGGGAHAGFFERRINVHYDPYYYYYTYYSYPSFGVAGIAGLEYKIPPIPFTVGLDLKPVIDFYYPGYSFLEGALTVRYVFGPND